ncbi:hypothetical protein BGZ90_001860 [Linnemannia elongata]|nr:hypothetical protein BGZ90_001860 [Linnemannia elongata]
MDDPLPKKRGKKPACSNFYNCTFVGKNTRQIETHEREYHDPEPLLIGDDDDSSNHPPVKIYRDPNQGIREYKATVRGFHTETTGGD